METPSLDEWQQQVLDQQGNIVLRSGRQVGKSFIIGIKTAEYALVNPNKTVMVISKTEKQAYLLFQKIYFNIIRISKTAIKKGKDRPTKHVINLKNGTTIHCLATGETGYGIMGFTLDLLIADEAAFIPECVWNSIIPALAITRGNVWLLSTPFLKEGYYYNCFQDPTFTSFHTTSEQCPRRDDNFLKHKKATLSKAEYAQMYLGQFVDEIKRLFPEPLINRICTAIRPNMVRRNAEHYIGCDVARMDRDEFSFEIVDKINNNMCIQVENIVTKDIPLPASVRKIVAMDDIYHFKLEYIDSGGMGIAVCDMLREYDNHKRRVVEINNASRPYDKDGHTKKTLKVDLYMNLLKLMQQGEIQLLKDDNLKESLRSMQADHNKDTGRISISGRYSHIAEGLVRAAWCMKEKRNKLWVY